MKSFYSLINISPNIATNDQVAIGVILFINGSFHSYFSERKKRLAFALLNDKNVNINFITKQIGDRCDSLNEELRMEKLFNPIEKFSDGSYFNYLNSYSNGILQFSKPNFISDKSGEIEIDKMISFLFSESLDVPVSKPKHSQFEETVDRKLISRVQSFIHTHYKFNNANLPSIYFPFELDCIGKNGILIGAKSLPLDKSFDTLEKSVSHYFTLISTLSANYNKSLLDNKFYLISEEPKLTSSKEHKLWESVKTNKIIEVVDPEESNIIADLIEQKQASKFLEEDMV